MEDEYLNQELPPSAQSPTPVKVEADSSLPPSDFLDIPPADIPNPPIGPEHETDVKIKLQGIDHSAAASIFSEFGESEVSGESLEAPFDIERIFAAQRDISQSIAEFMIPPPRVDAGGDDLKLFDASLIPTAAQADVKFLSENPYASLRWTALITKLGDSGSNWPPAFVRNVLQSCLRVYRRSPNVWMLYIKHLWDSRDLALAMKQFQTALHLCPHVDLFRVYLKCVRVIFQDKFQDAAARELLRHAHEFSVEKIGMDVYSLPIWQEYISLLKDLNLETEVPPLFIQFWVFMAILLNPLYRFERLTSAVSEFLSPMLKESKTTGMTSNVAENYKIRAKSLPKPLLNWCVFPMTTIL
jgi:hypothetical protein